VTDLDDWKARRSEASACRIAILALAAILVAAVSALGAEDSFDGVHTGKRELTKGSCSMVTTERGGQNREANITGTIRQLSWLIASIQGSGVVCRNVKMRWHSPASPH
jgi:hypothetical protein